MVNIGRNREGINADKSVGNGEGISVLVSVALCVGGNVCWWYCVSVVLGVGCNVCWRRGVLVVLCVGGATLCWCCYFVLVVPCVGGNVSQHLR